MFHSSLHSVSSDFFSFPPIFRSLHFLRPSSFFSSFFLTLFFTLFLFLLVAFIISFLTSTCSPSTRFPISFLHFVAFLLSFLFLLLSSPSLTLFPPSFPHLDTFIFSCHVSHPRPASPPSSLALFYGKREIEKENLHPPWSLGMFLNRLLLGFSPLSAQETEPSLRLAGSATPYVTGFIFLALTRSTTTRREKNRSES